MENATVWPWWSMLHSDLCHPMLAHLHQNYEQLTMNLNVSPTQTTLDSKLLPRP